jgi:hypothetical protein
MWRNACFCTGITLIIVISVLLHTATFLIPYKRLLFHSYLWPMLIYTVLLTANLIRLYQFLARKLLHKDSGDKLRLIEEQFRKGNLDPELAAQLLEQQ